MREKTYVAVVFAPFQNVPRNGHCLRAKMNLNETKKKERKKERKEKGAMSRLQHGRTHHREGEECVGSNATRGLHVRERVCDTTQSSMEACVDGATCTETPRIVSMCRPHAGCPSFTNQAISSDNLWIILLNKHVYFSYTAMAVCFSC